MILLFRSPLGSVPVLFSLRGFDPMVQAVWGNRRMLGMHIQRGFIFLSSLVRASSCAKHLQREAFSVWCLSFIA